MSNQDKAIRDTYGMVQGGMSILEVCELLEMDEAQLRREWISRQYDLRGLSISDALKRKIREDWNRRGLSRGDYMSAREEMAKEYGVSIKTVVKYTKTDPTVSDAEEFNSVQIDDQSVWAERSQRAEELVRKGQATWSEINKACGHDLKCEWIRYKIFD